MDHYIWLIWMIIAAAFVIGEIFTAGFFLLWFGIGAAAAGVLALLEISFVWQILVFIVVSFTLFILTKKIAQKVTVEQPSGVGADRFVGQDAVVLQEIDNITGTGRVRMNREEWRAESADNVKIAVGTQVKVTQIDGTHLIVKQ